jgi:hypothetical protein
VRDDATTATSCAIERTSEAAMTKTTSAANDGQSDGTGTRVGRRDVRRESLDTMTRTSTTIHTKQPTERLQIIRMRRVRGDKVNGEVAIDDEPLIRPLCRVKCESFCMLIDIFIYSF